MTTTSPEQALAAATAAATVLPAAGPLTAGAPRPGEGGVAATFGGAAVAELDLPGAPRIAVLVGTDLVEALAGSPLGGLDLAAAVQPALDAAATAVGATAGAARAVEPDHAVAELGGPFTVVPLDTDGVETAALLVADAALDRTPPAPEAAAGPAFAPLTTDTPAPAPAPVAASAAHRGIEMLHGVDMELTVELGRAQMTVRELLALSPGAVLELDRAAGSPADLLVNGRLIARGEVVVIDEDFGLRVTEIIDASAAS